MKTEVREHDLTKTSWGHNYSVIDWPKGKLFVWLTPGPREGDVLLIQGNKGIIRAKVTESEWLVNVDDMYKVTVTPDDKH